MELISQSEGMEKVHVPQGSPTRRHGRERHKYNYFVILSSFTLMYRNSFLPILNYSAFMIEMPHPDNLGSPGVKGLGSGSI